MLKYKVNLLRDSRQCLLYHCTSVPILYQYLRVCTVRTYGRRNGTGPASKAARYELDMHPVETKK